MEQINQYQNIIEAFKLKKDNLLADITRVNTLINKRVESLGRIKSYQNEYVVGEKLALSKSVPTLTRNLNSFTNKLQEIVLLEEIEIGKLESLRESKLIELGKIEEKILLLEKLTNDLNQKYQYQLNTLEQNMLDEFVLLKQMSKESA